MKIAVVSLIALALSACATTPTSVVVQPADVAPMPATPVAPAVPAGQQWLFASAEGAVATGQTYRELAAYTQHTIAKRPRDSVVLAAGATPAAPSFVPCGKKPFAAVFDADETLIFNLGSMRWFAEHGVTFDPKVWDEWERTGAGKAMALPGAVDALAALRDRGVTIIVNTNRSSATAEGTVATLRAAGLGEFKHGESLFLMGDDADGSSKDMRRATIADRFCVIALVGDQLGDFSQRFNDKGLSIDARRMLATATPIASLWARGWFLLPNPVYGPSIRGSFDEVFSADSRWTPTQGQRP
ncbi:MAG: HAD family acid phosphatase [Sphingomonadales bacterium]